MGITVNDIFLAVSWFVGFGLLFWHPHDGVALMAISLFLIAWRR